VPSQQINTKIPKLHIVFTAEVLSSCCEVITVEEYKNLIQKAVKAIDENRLSDARSILSGAVSAKVTGPESYNLFGILEEYQGNYAEAAKFYRAAYAFDPAYRPASRNLSRITRFSGGATALQAEFGPRSEDENDDCDYAVEVDEHGIGRIHRKKEKI
jgi:tetratricopeptide (TPR) repeat protein